MVLERGLSYSYHKATVRALCTLTQQKFPRILRNLQEFINPNKNYGRHIWKKVNLLEPKNFSGTKIIFKNSKDSSFECQAAQMHWKHNIWFYRFGVISQQLHGVPEGNLLKITYLKIILQSIQTKSSHELANFKKRQKFGSKLWKLSF